MFILEESQLLEDVIKSPNVLKLYKTLRSNENSNDREPLVSGILKDDLCTELLQVIFDIFDANEVSLNNPTATIGKLTAEQKEEIFTELNLDQNDVANLALILAASLTQLFVIDNFAGLSSDETIEQSYKSLPKIYKILTDKIDYTSLAVDGSDIYHLTANPWLLRSAQHLWTLVYSIGCSRRMLELEFLVWRHRMYTIQVMISVEPSETLSTELRKIQEFIFDHHIINESKENNTQLVRFNIVELCCELIQSAILRDSFTTARKIIDYVSEFSGVTIQHTGVLGKRTKFQQTDVPQLMIKVKRDVETKQRQEQVSLLNDQISEEDIAGLPKDIKLDDDTLLPDIAFVAEDECGDKKIDESDISPEAQLLMLAKLDFILKTEVMEESLKDEWTQAYLRSIIKSSSIWSVRYKALAIRSIVEKKHMRKMDRALLQMEDLIKTTCEQKDTTSITKRMKFIYAVLPQSRWQVKRSLGDISFDLALFKNALEIYTQIEYWEGIIKCYNMLGQTNKAEKILRQELEKEETPYLYCLLGDATDNIEHYEKSWTLSNKRFARAKKSIGTHYYVRKQYAEAIEHYEDAAKANPSNISILSMLAYSCLTIERYDRAAECYRNLTYLDDTNFLAWNNLSKAYIKLNQKERAWRTLREAIKCNFEEWKVWENFMLVSMQIGALDDVITAWHRLVDLKAAHKDDQILSALTHQILKRSYNEKDTELPKLLGEALKLLARLNTTSACSSRVWICYFKLLIREFELMLSGRQEGKEVSKLDYDARVSKITNALQRATPTSMTSDADWFRVPEKVVKVIDCYDELVDCYLFALEVLGARKELWNQWKNFKLSINNAIRTLHNQGYKT